MSGSSGSTHGAGSKGGLGAIPGAVPGVCRGGGTGFPPLEVGFGLVAVGFG